MPARYDDVVEKNKKYLTRAQIKALAEASQRYDAMHASNRAEAQQSMQNQYDAGFRALQNMGLAGAAATSGEVPRLQQQVQTPFDQYNQKLRDVEHQQLGVLASAYAKQTRRRRAAEAARRAAEEARKAAEERQREQAAYQHAQTAANAINRRNGYLGPKVTAEDLAVPNMKIYEKSTTTAQDVQAAQQELRAAQAQWEKLRASGMQNGVGGKETFQAYQKAIGKFATLRDKYEAAQAQLNNGTRSAQMQARALAESGMVSKQFANAGEYRGQSARYAWQNAPQAADAMAQQYNTPANTATPQNVGNMAAPGAFHDLRMQRPNGQNDKAPNPAIDPALTQEYETAQQEMQKAQAQWEKLRASGMQNGVGGKETYQAYQKAAEKFNAVREKYAVEKAKFDLNSADPAVREQAKLTLADHDTRQVTQAMGISAPTMTDEDFNAAAQIIPQLRRILKTIDDEKNKMPDMLLPEDAMPEPDQEVIDAAVAELKKLGYNEQQARDFVKNFDKERFARRDYNAYQNAYRAFYLHDGEQPRLPINNEETDPVYRAVNNMPDLETEAYNRAQMDNPQLGPVNKTWSEQEKASGNVDYMTKEQRDAYNAIYEREGVEAANKYASDILPLIEMRRAAEDKKYLEQLASEHGVQAWMLARATNLMSNIPAMMEKMAVAAENTYNENATGGTNIPKRYSYDSATSRVSNWTDIIQAKQSQDILAHYNEQGREKMGKVVNFLYETGTSMADSAIAMAISGAAGSWATDVLFFSSAGNQAYKDAIERGGTQEQAMAMGVLSGFAESFFEHASIEHFMNLDHKGKFAFLKNMLSQSVAEASEEISTEIANILSDALIMKDKSEFNQAVEEYMSDGLSKGKAQRQALLDQLKNIGMAGLGGLASGLGFGLVGTARSAVDSAMTAKAKADMGKAIIENGDVKTMRDVGVLLGGESQTAAEKVDKKETSSSVGNLAANVEQEITQLGTNDPDQQVAVQRFLDGKQMDVNEAEDVLTVLGAEKLQKMGYDTTSASAFMASYNARVSENSVASREERRAIASERRFENAKEAAAKRVWANPNQGLSMVTEEGTTVTPMPGNMTAVARAEQERTGFKARTTATSGRATYAVAGMQTRQGLTNEQTYNEIMNGLTKEARQKAKVYEQLADALGVDMVIHDVMVGTNGFIDENGKMHVVLSGKQSVLRVAAHELTHFMKDNAAKEYGSLRNHLVAEVGSNRFDRMVKQKAKEYGLDLSTDKGKTVADDEVCAELCERMLSNEEALERFAEKDTAAAKTLKGQLLKILNAIKSAFKRAENRNFGESWSDLITEQQTIEGWIEGLQKAVENADARAATTEGQIAQVAGVTTVDQQQMENDLKRELFLSDDVIEQEARKAAAEAYAEKGTDVPGIEKAEMERILSRAMFGKKENYGAADYKRARSMLAQMVPEIISALNGNADFEDMQKRMETVVGMMLDTYYEEYGDHSSLKEFIPQEIAVDATAKGDLQSQDTSLLQMSNKLSNALGRRVTLVSRASAKAKTAMKLDELWQLAKDAYGLSDYQDFSADATKLVDFIQSQASTRSTFSTLYESKRADIVANQVNELVNAVDEMLSERVDKVIAEHSVDIIEYDMIGYRQDLMENLVPKGIMSEDEIDDLFSTMIEAVKYVKFHRDILDFGFRLSEEAQNDPELAEKEIQAAKAGRAYLPYKQNADPHYKLALDFSTLCKKRILLQMIQERLQGKLGRALSALETIAVRREIQKLQKNGVNVEVACALCYVEAARLKSPKVINEFLGVGKTKSERAQNVRAEMANYFAQKDKSLKKYVDEEKAKWKAEKLGADWIGTDKKGRAITADKATKDQLKAFGGQKLVDEFNAFSKKTRTEAEMNARQQETIDKAVKLVEESPETFLSAESLAKLKLSDPDIFYAFTNKVRSATRSKALETDTFYARGDINMVEEGIIRAANQESGFRHQSWSDFMPIHLLDTMASIIEMSQRDAKMHTYTKVPEMVRLLGKTGMMLNLSLIPKGETGLNADGTLAWDSVEGMAWEVMMELRDAYADTVGNIAIGISDEQIRQLLASDDIDYVIPYHVSGMNKTLRSHMGIHTWLDFTSSQNESEREGKAPSGRTWKEEHKARKMKPPALEAWFKEKDAKAAGKNGVAYMQKAAQDYLDICARDGWVPKFSQYLDYDAKANKYTVKPGYENYWKMLTDRKMVNQKTGEVIIQQAVKPKFDNAVVMDILRSEAEDPTAIRNAAAADEIAGELGKTWRGDKENANLKSYKAELDAFREASAVMAADRVKEDVKRRLAETRNSLDTDYMRLAEKYKSGTATETETKSLQSVVEQAAEAAMPNSVARGKDGKLIKFFHGTKAEFTKFERSKIGSTGRFEGSGFNFTPYEGRARSYGGRVLEGYLNIQHPLSADKKTFSVAKLAQLIRNIDPTGDNIIANYAQNTNDYGTPSFIRRESMTTARALLEYNESDVDVYSDLSSADPDAESLIRAFSDMGYDGLIHYDSNGNIKTAVAFSSEQFKLADPITYDDDGNIIPLSERFNLEKEDIRYSIDTDSIRQAFTTIDTTAIEDGLEALKGVKHVGSFALKDISRFLDASAGKNKDLRNTLHAIFEAPHSEATGRYARGVERMQQRVLDIGQRAGVCDAKGKHFDSKKSAAIQNIGEGFSNTYTDLKLKVKDAEHVTVQAFEPGTDTQVVKERDYTLKELRQAYGTNAADYVWELTFKQAEDAQATGGKAGWTEEHVNTRPYTLTDLQKAFPNDWQKLKAAADEFRQMYDEYIRDQNNMLSTIYPIESEYADVEKLEAAIEKKQERLEKHKAAVADQLKALQEKLEAKEKETARTKSGKKRDASTNTYRQLVEQADKIKARINELTAEIKEYEANAKDELVKMNTLKAEMQNAKAKGDDSLKRMHRLQYRSDYFHHFTEMASGIQNLKAVFTNNTDIAPAIVGKSENTKAKTRWAGYFQQRMGGDYTADAMNGMLRYGQLAEYKLAFDPLTAYLRDVTNKVANMSSETNRDGLIRYLQAWTDNIAGKSHRLDRVVSDSGMAPRKAMQVLQWINSRVIQNTLLWNMRSALVQISNITNAKGIVKNNLDWMNGLRAWAMAARGDEAMASIMSQSNFLASRYMDGLQLTDSKLKSAKQFAGWMLGALDEVSAKATWWAAYQQYTRNPNVAKNQYRAYESAVDYADDITRRTHAGRGVGELAPAMTSKVVNFVAPFQVEVNNTWQLLKDNVKQHNYLGLLSTGLSVFLFNTAFEAIVGSTPLGFDFIRAVMDIVLGFTNDDDDDDPDAKEIAQRFAGELVGGLPFASQLVAAFGEDNAKKLLGENNDATRYGNTQIGVNAVVNAAKGLKDIGSGLIEGRRVNWIDDLDDLLNLTMPMGAKQLTRTAQGLLTVAKGYAGKYDKKGDEQVQFVTDSNLLKYIHAGLFGKWALTEASEYFGEKRLLPELFGKYHGPKSSTGNMVDAKEYKAALATGIDGKEYFTLKSDLKGYSTQAGKRAELMQKNLTPEQKAQLDALMIVDSKKETKTKGGIVYQKNSDGEWDVKADYTSATWNDVAELGTKRYDQARDAAALGMKPEMFLGIYDKWKGTTGDKKSQMKEFLDGLRLPKNQYDYIWATVFGYKK